MLKKLPAQSTEAWESGFQSVGPRRYQKLWIPLTSLSHPEWLWELRRLDSYPPQPAEIPVAQTEIAAGELFLLAAGFLRFLRAAIWAIVATKPSLFGTKITFCAPFCPSVPRQVPSSMS